MGDGPRADEVQVGYVALNGTVVTATSTVYGDDTDDGVTTLWWNEGPPTFTVPNHRMEPSRKASSEQTT